MSQRKKVSDSTQAEILVKSRRRCSACFGLERDCERKKGQIAHLDGDKNNNHESNLVFLCFDHHDEYDSTTSQSKGLQRKEIEIYREELYQQFSAWSGQLQYKELLNFLAFNADTRSIANATIKAARTTTCHGVDLAFQILITDDITYSDGDLYIPYLATLDHFASWGLLTFTEEESLDIDGMPAVSINVKRKPICDELANEIIKIQEENKEDIKSLLHMANYVNWAHKKNG